MSQTPPTDNVLELRDQIVMILDGQLPPPIDDLIADPPEPHLTNAHRAGLIIALLGERGNIVANAPPAEQILKDARSFADRLTLSNLALRIVRMVLLTGVVTPESKGAERWMRDYLDGRNHGPVGQPLLWPRQLPGIASLLRDWGYQPTHAGPGAFVARVPPGLQAVSAASQ